MIDLSKLTEAVTAVAGIAAERDAAVTAVKDAQAGIDALTASLIAATTSPAGAVGIAAVAAALDPQAVAAKIDALADMTANLK